MKKQLILSLLTFALIGCTPVSNSTVVTDNSLGEVKTKNQEAVYASDTTGTYRISLSSGARIKLNEIMSEKIIVSGNGRYIFQNNGTGAYIYSTAGEKIAEFSDAKAVGWLDEKVIFIQDSVPKTSDLKGSVSVVTENKEALTFLEASEVFISPNEKYLAFLTRGDEGNSVSVVSLKTGAIVTKTVNEGVSDPVWINSDKLMWSEGKKLYFADFRLNEINSREMETEITGIKPWSENRVLIGSNGRYFTVLPDGSELKAYNILDNKGIEFDNVHLAVDAQHIIYAKDNEVRIVKADGTNDIRLSEFFPSQVVSTGI